MSNTLPPLPEPHGWIYDGIPNMLLFNRGPLPQATALVCSTAPVYSADQMRFYAAAALAAAVATEREMASEIERLVRERDEQREKLILLLELARKAGHGIGDKK